MQDHVHKPPKALILQKHKHKLNQSRPAEANETTHRLKDKHVCYQIGA